MKKDKKEKIVSIEASTLESNILESESQVKNTSCLRYYDSLEQYRDRPIRFYSKIYDQKILNLRAKLKEKQAEYLKLQKLIEANPLIDPLNCDNVRDKCLIVLGPGKIPNRQAYYVHGSVKGGQFNNHLVVQTYTIRWDGVGFYFDKKLKVRNLNLEKNKGYLVDYKDLSYLEIRRTITNLKDSLKPDAIEAKRKSVFLRIYIDMFQISSISRTQIRPVKSYPDFTIREVDKYLDLIKSFPLIAI